MSDKLSSLTEQISGCESITIAGAGSTASDCDLLHLVVQMHGGQNMAAADVVCAKLSECLASPNSNVTPSDPSGGSVPPWKRKARCNAASKDPQVDLDMELVAKCKLILGMSRR